MTTSAPGHLAPASDPHARRVQVVRLLSGAIFFVAGIPKFAARSWESGHFRTYGLPAPDAFVYLIGVLEIAGGLALLAGFAIRPVALVLGSIMVGAIAVSGIGQGEWVPSLTLAPALLAAMAYLLIQRPAPR